MIESTFCIFIPKVPDQYVQRRSHRQSKQNTQETKQLTTGQYREYDGNRVQANPVPDQFWCQHHSFQCLSGAKNQQDHDRVEQVLELKNSGQDRGNQADHCPQVRNNAEQAGAHANDKCQVQTNQPQARGVDGAKREHDHQLPANKSPQDFIYFTGKSTDSWFDFPWQQLANSLDKQVPVPQQVKRDHGNQTRFINHPSTAWPLLETVPSTLSAAVLSSFQ